MIWAVTNINAVEPQDIVIPINVCPKKFKTLVSKIFTRAVKNRNAVVKNLDLIANAFRKNANAFRKKRKREETLASRILIRAATNRNAVGTHIVIPINVCLKKFKTLVSKILPRAVKNRNAVVKNLDFIVTTINVYERKSTCASRIMIWAVTNRNAVVTHHIVIPKIPIRSINVCPKEFKALVSKILIWAVKNRNAVVTHTENLNATMINAFQNKSQFETSAQHMEAKRRHSAPSFSQL